MAKVGIIANPHAKLNKQKPSLIPELQALASDKAWFRASASLTHLGKIAEEFAHLGVDTLAICGGDGTLSQTLSAIGLAYKGRPLPTIALLRGGTMNLLAQNLGLRGSPKARLTRLLAEVEKPLPKKPILSLSVNNHLGFTFATGTSALFLKEYYLGNKSLSSCLSLVAKLAASYFINRKFFDRIVLPQQTSLSSESGVNLQGKMISVLAATVDKLPLALPLFPGALESVNDFTVVAVTHTPTQLALRGLNDFLFFPKSESSGKLRFHSKDLTLHLAVSSIYTIDGDIFEPEEDTIKVRRGPVIDFLVF